MSHSIAQSGSIVRRQRVLLCNHGGDCCQFSSNLLQLGPGSLRQIPGKVGGHCFSSHETQYLSDKDHHRVSASVMKAVVQVKRRWQAQHLDRVELADQQVVEEGETYGSGRFSHHRTGRTHLRSSTITTTSSKLFF